MHSHYSISQVLISLCVVGLTAAAPQLAFSGAPRAVAGDQNVIVSNVVTALEPAIAEAVANALRSLQSSSSSSSFDSERAQFEAEFATNNGGAVNAKAEYNFNYQVRDDEKGTYIYQQEARDGDDVTGNYGFVDPNGTLVKVTYQAGAEGFTQSLEQEENFLKGSNSRTSSAAASSGSRKASTSQAAAFNEEALIAQIIRALQPTISTSVEAALASSF